MEWVLPFFSSVLDGFSNVHPTLEQGGSGDAVGWDILPRILAKAPRF